MSVALTSADRAAAIALLKHRLSGRELRTVLDQIQGTSGRGRRQRKGVEWLVAEAEGSGRRLRSRLSEEELPEFLIDLTGGELLACRELRLSLARGSSDSELEILHDGYAWGARGRGGRDSQAKAISNRNWHPGKSWAMHFCRTLGFPSVFAGVRGVPAPPPREEVEPFRPLPNLEEFQVELKAQVLEILGGPSGANRGILTLPTGAGKTRTAVEGILEWKRVSADAPAVLWIAQSDELCEQAVQAFREVWIDMGHRDPAIRETLTLNRLWGGREEMPDGNGVTVASIQKLHALYRQHRDNLAELEPLKSAAAAIVVDEAHRMLAPSYAEVLRLFGVEVARGEASPIPLLGLTATPFRAVEDETKQLARRFHGRLLRPPSLQIDPIAQLRERDVLSRPVHQILDYDGREFSVDESEKFRAYYEQFGDFHPDLLREISEERERNQKLVEKICSLPEDWPVLFFGCSVEHAQAVAVLLRRKGRSAATVTSDTRTSTRRFLIEEFRAGRVSVLCNYGVLTTGFDAPKVRAIVVARPTTSPVLYEQMIGRGLRGSKFGGTSECLVIDVLDNIQFGGQMAFTRYEEYWTSTE